MTKDVTMRVSGSRLAACPVCDKSVHVALVAMHVERCLTMNATTSASDAGLGTASLTTTTTTTTTTDTGRRGERQDSRDRENEGDARRASEASATGRSGGVLKELAAARRASAARESASPSVGVDLKRRRIALADATNAQDGVMRGFVKAIGATVLRSGMDAATQTENDDDGPNGLCADNDATVDEVDVEKVVQDVEGGEPSSVVFDLRVMSGNHEECGICLTTFDDDDGVVRHMFYPCQHVRQCGECAQRVWQVPKAKRRCPWCKSKIEIRPRPFKPFL